MNDRIKLLAKQATINIGDEFHPIDFFDKEKFAELIVQECAESLWTGECYHSDLALEEFERNSAKIKRHFGVEE
jgi:hypothetical protein